MKTQLFRTLAVAGLMLGLALFGLSSVAKAQLAKDKSMGAGLALGLANTPEESKFSQNGTPIDLHFDWNLDSNWLKFRFGYNLGAGGRYKFSYFNKTWTNDLTTDSLYGAWRYSMAFMGDALQAYALAGIAMMSTTLKIDPGAASATDSVIGITAGAGAIYSLGAIGVGGQYQFFSGTAKPGGASLAAGSNQISLVANYSF
jgi:hypothetical protein